MSEESRIGSNGTGRKKHLFVVDDEQMLVDLADAILSHEGYCVETFLDPSMALGRLRAANPKPDLLITDCVMYGMDGLALIQEARETNSGIRCLLLSGTVDQDYLDNHPVKPDRFLRKPYRAEALVTVVRELLNSAE